MYIYIRDREESSGEEGKEVCQGMRVLDSESGVVGERERERWGGTLLYSTAHTLILILYCLHISLINYSINNNVVFYILFFVDVLIWF